MFIVLLACVIAEDGPASPGSAAATEVATVEEMGQLAAGIEAKAADLEELSKLARATDDPEERAALSKRIQEALASIDEKDTRIQELLAGLETDLSGGVDPHDRPQTEPEPETD